MINVTKYMTSANEGSAAYLSTPRTAKCLHVKSQVIHA